MSGIIGLWNFDGAPVQRALVERLAAALHHRGPDATGIWTEGGAGMAACLLRVTPESLAEVQPLVAPGEAVVVFDGRLDNREELLAEAQHSDGLNKDSPDPALVLAAYRKHGEKFAGHLNGDFAVALFDMRKRELFLARDFLGMRPLYHARIGETFIFASEIKAILAYPGFERVPNENALAVFLAQGFSQDANGATLFSGVYSCPPAHVLAVTQQRNLASRYWSFENAPARPVKKLLDGMEEFRSHFDRAVRRRMRSAFPVAVSVSGGVDSSSVFCVAETARRSAPQALPAIIGASLAYSDGSPADEKQFLVKIEQQYGVSIHRFPAGPAGDGAGRVIRDGIWHAETPLMDSQWNDTHVFYEALAAQGARVLLSGHWGDQLLDDQSHLVDLFHGMKFAALGSRLRGFQRWKRDAPSGYVRQQFLEDLLGYHKRYLPQFVVRVLRRLRGRHQLPAVYSESLRRRAQEAEWQKKQTSSGFSSFHAQSLSTKLVSGYYSSCLEELNKVTSTHSMEIAFPFLDRDLLGFVMEAPAELYSAEAVPRALLRQGMRRVVPGGILDRRWKADFSNHINALMLAEYSSMAFSVSNAKEIVERGYVNREQLGPALERWKAEIQMQGSSSEAAWELQKVCRLEMWLNVFFGEASLN